MAQRNFLFKIVVVGDGGVGKSTMIQRLITGKFIPMKITIGTDLKMYSIPIDDNTLVALQIWDFAGEKRFRIFLPNYSSGASGCLLCYDMSRYSSFKNLTEWFEIVSKNATDPVYILVGGKADLAGEKRAVPKNEVEEFKDKHNIDYFFETSSKTGENNEKIFETLTRAILEKNS